jgi:hypothetical protein
MQSIQIIDLTFDNKMGDELESYNEEMTQLKTLCASLHSQSSQIIVKNIKSLETEIDYLQIQIDDSFFSETQITQELKKSQAEKIAQHAEHIYSLEKLCITQESINKKINQLFNLTKKLEPLLQEKQWEFERNNDPSTSA